MRTSIPLLCLSLFLPGCMSSRIQVRVQDLGPEDEYRLLVETHSPDRMRRHLASTILLFHDRESFVPIVTERLMEYGGSSEILSLVSSLKGFRVAGSSGKRELRFRQRDEIVTALLEYWSTHPEAYPLHTAAGMDDKETLLWLFHKGTGIEDRNDLGTTPLHLAVEAGSLDIAEILLTRGADPNARESRHLETPLHRAAYLGEIAIARALLKTGADPSASDSDGYTPLHWAALQNRPQTIDLLLRAGADPEARTSAELTPAALAESRGNAEALKALTEGTSVR